MDENRRTTRLDAWMAAHPWHPRVLPFVLYVALLLPLDLASDRWAWTYPLLYSAQCSVVFWLMWRYRPLLLELNWRFHWLALPVGVAVCAVWIALGRWMVALAPSRYAMDEPHLFETMTPALRHTSMALRLVGMSVIVPMFEELFIRSLLLRSLHSARRVGIAVVQFLQDVPVLGDWLMHTPLAERADRHTRVLGDEFERVPLGALSVFGVAASTFIFMLGHIQRDWPGTIACGVAYCALLWWTNRRNTQLGLGPVIWAHGITNALLWAYTLQSGDWQFL